MQVITSILVLAVFFVVFIITDIKSYKQRKVENMVGIAHVVGTNSASSLQFQRNDEGRRILQELHSVMPEILHAVIYDRSGNVFASYTGASHDSLHFFPNLASNKSTTLNDHLFVSSEIIEENEKLGKVVLESEFVELEQMNRSKFKLAALILTFSIGFSFLVAFLMQTYISKRLLKLVGSIKEVGKTGDYSKSIEEDGKDEISTLTKEFNRLMEKVYESQQRKDQFISISSHELKTPLTTVKGYLELLERNENINAEKPFIQKALKNANKLDSLIKDLLDVSKIQSGQLKLNLQKFNLDTLVDESIAAAKIGFPNHEIIREGNFDNEQVLADRLRIEQVLNNLLSNAIKYSPGERKIIVYSNKTDKDLIVKVRDYGIGVPENERASIFERFYRTKDMPVSISGFGLGLYICRDIIKRHHGQIWLEAQEKGTAFYFSLPKNGITEA
jgi:signal transduction histidine kinase